MADERTKPYTVDELARDARVTETYIRRLLRHGKLTGSKFGDVWMIPVDEGRRWLSSRRARWEKF